MSTTIYVAMINDNHEDPEVFLFSAPEAAIEFASASARKRARFPELVAEEELEGFLYFAEYSEDEDAVWVLEKALDDPEATP